MTRNKFTTYLLYAIGEIILVVIGILIAVGINDWNQTRKNSTTEKEYLTNLLNDLRLQKTEIQLQLDAENRAKVAIDSISLIVQKEINLNDLPRLNKHLSMLIFSRTFNLINPTFEDLTATGNLKLITNDSLRNLIVSYHESAERIGKVLTKYDTKQSALEEIVRNGVINIDLEGYDFISDRFQFESPVPTRLFEKDTDQAQLEQLKTPEKTLLLRNSVQVRFFTYQISIIFLGEIMDNTNTLIDQIEKEVL